MEGKKGEKEKRRSFLPALLMAVLLAFTLSSGMVGFLLGRNAARSTGKLVDTIVLSPGDSSQRQQPTLHFLTGKVQYREGDPCVGATVRLGDKGQTDVTDEQGKFYFSDVRSGEYDLEVVDDSGNLLADTSISLDFSAGADVSADPAAAPAVFQMPEDARMLELTLTVEGDRTLEVKEDSAYFVTRDGEVVDFSGASLRLQDGERAVTPGGNLADAQGYVLLPSKQVAITPQGEQTPSQPGEEILPGVVLEEDGSAKIGTEAVLLPTGEVHLPDGETVDRNQVVVVTEDEGAQALEKLPEQYTPSAGQEAAGGDEPSSGESQAEEGSAGSSSPEEASGPEEKLGDEPQGIAVTDSATGSVWKQQSFIDLFKNRTDDLNLGEEDGVPLAAPGAKGYYEFRLENPKDFDIAYTISLDEQSFHLPIHYTLIDQSNRKSYLYQTRISPGKTLDSDEILIPAGTVQDFRIDWSWDYEDWFDPERDDSLDTAAGTSADRTYIVTVTVSAEEVSRPQAVGSDGEGTRYPGMR